MHYTLLRSLWHQWIPSNFGKLLWIKRHNVIISPYSIILLLIESSLCYHKWWFNCWCGSERFLPSFWMILFKRDLTLFTKFIISSFRPQCKRSCSWSCTKNQNWLLTQNIQNSFDTWHGKILFLLCPRSHYSRREHKKKLKFDNIYISFTFSVFLIWINSHALTFCQSNQWANDSSISVATFQEQRAWPKP